MKRSNVRIIGIHEGVEKEKALQEILEQPVAENFHNLVNKTSIHVQKVERTPPKINENRPTPCHIIVQFANLRMKDNLVSNQGEENPPYRERNIRIMLDLSTEIWQGRKS